MNASAKPPSAIAHRAFDQRPAADRARAALVRLFVGVGVLVAALVVLLAWALTGTLWSTGTMMALSAYALGLAVAGRVFQHSYPHAQLGLCNAVTLLRLGLVASLVVAFVAAEVAPLPLLLVAGTAFVLDGVDGWLARRAALASDFGARFDVEVDSVFALLLAGLAVQSGLHPLVLLLGLPRYVFGIAQGIYPRLTAPLPPRFSRKVVCVAQIATLIFLLLPGIDPAIKHAAAALAGVLLAWSFAVDIRAILRTSAA